MRSTIDYLQEWQKALQAEIYHLQNKGSSKYRVYNGRLLSSNKDYIYYFDLYGAIKVPIGALIKLEWGLKVAEGRILSSEGRNVIVSLGMTLGDDIAEAVLLHDPWELLDALHERLEEMKKSKRKRARIKRLMAPPDTAKHPIDNIKSPVHELILRTKYNPVTFVWGPPGTGKTYTLARTAANKYFKDQKVLVLAHSNQAVDVLMAEISQFTKKHGKFKEGELLRYGSQITDALSGHEELSINYLLLKQNRNLSDKKENLQRERMLLKQDLTRSFSVRDSNSLIEVEKKLGDVLEKIRLQEMKFIKDAVLIGTTLAKSANDPTIYEHEFDVVIIDEASMAYVPQIAFAAGLAKRVIICGDFKQLPPIAASRHSLVNTWLKEDIFHHSGVANTVNEGRLHANLFLLKEQRRMHPDISSFTNKHIYHGLVGDHESVKALRQPLAERMPFSGNASILLDTSGAGNFGGTEQSSSSRINLWQLLLSFQLLHEAYCNGSRSIGYVTPYRAQAKLMEELLLEIYGEQLIDADIAAATVHRFQGDEREVMIFDTVDSFPHDRAGMLLTGKDSERLLNVAITRTKGKFIHVADTTFVREKVHRNKVWRKLTDYQLQADQAVFPQQIGTWVQHQHEKIQWVHARKLAAVFADIQNAKTEICLVVTDHVLEEQWLKMLEHRQQSVLLTIIGEERVDGLASDRFIDASPSFPHLIIDRKITWLGMPIAMRKNALPPFVGCRVEAETIGRMLNSLHHNNIM